MMKIKDLFSVEGKVALITGGTKGIGEMIASAFMANGAKVYITSRTADECHETAKRLSGEFGGECIAIIGDIGSMAGVEALAYALSEREEKLNILVNNAGASWSGPVDDFPEKGWDVTFNVNVKAPFFLIQKLLPLLRNAASHEDPARVVNIASVGGIKNPKFHNYSYGPSKAAVIHMTRQTGAALVKENIILNAIAPGPFPTEMLTASVGRIRGTGTIPIDWPEFGTRNPRGRVGSAEDIGGLAIFLCSRAGAFTVGATITCDGGAVAIS